MATQAVPERGDDSGEALGPGDRKPKPVRRIERRRGVGDFASQWGLPAIGIALSLFGGWYVWSRKPVAADPPPPIQPARSPFAGALAAAGMVEAQTENISVGSATPGVVVEVLVRVGDAVRVGTPLFRLDDRELQGQLAVKRAAVAHWKSELLRQEAEPRKEKLPVQIAEVNEAKAVVAAAEDALKRARETFSRKVTTEQDLVEKEQALATAKAALERSQADLSLLEAGSWEYDRDVTRAVITEAEAEVARIQIEIDRLVVRSLVQGRVLQVNVRPGEYVGAPPGQPLVMLGDVEKLHVRVDIDEFDIGRFREGADAEAFPRGFAQTAAGYPLSFVRVEPFVVPKKSLTGDNTERVDTRVLQVIYELDPAAPSTAGLPRLFVGQQMDVFIREMGDSVAGEASAAPAR
jgi:HlyD family secretion protein